MLVIVVLVIGGILQSREMMANRKLKRIENDCAAIAAGIETYRNLYGELPGDDPAASARFAGEWSAMDNGDGDGLITGGWDSMDNSSESRKFWKHLRGAGLIEGPVDNSNPSYQQPTGPFDGAIGIDRNTYNIRGFTVVFARIPGNVAAMLEERGDDGAANTGRMQGHMTHADYEHDLLYDLAVSP